MPVSSPFLIAAGLFQCLRLLCHPGLVYTHTFTPRIALRERFGEPVDVMGISGGGVTAPQLALDHPGLCGTWAYHAVVWLVRGKAPTSRHDRAHTAIS